MSMFGLRKALPLAPGPPVTLFPSVWAVTASPPDLLTFLLDRLVTLTNLLASATWSASFLMTMPDFGMKLASRHDLDIRLPSGLDLLDTPTLASAPSRPQMSSHHRGCWAASGGHTSVRCGLQELPHLRL